MTIPTCQARVSTFYVSVPTSFLSFPSLSSPSFAMFRLHATKTLARRAAESGAHWTFQWTIGGRSVKHRLTKTHEVTEQHTYQKTEQNTYQKTVGTYVRMAGLKRQQVSESTTEKVSKHMSDLATGHTSEHRPNRMSEHLRTHPRTFPACMLDDMPEHIPELMPESVCQDSLS